MHHSIDFFSGEGRRAQIEKPVHHFA
jgi:hypothetical protein